jgi:hypothetical protein
MISPFLPLSFLFLLSASLRLFGTIKYQQKALSSDGEAGLLHIPTLLEFLCICLSLCCLLCLVSTCSTIPPYTITTILQCTLLTLT